MLINVKCNVIFFYLKINYIAELHYDITSNSNKLTYNNKKGLLLLWYLKIF